MAIPPLTTEEHLPILLTLRDACPCVDEECARAERCNIDLRPERRKLAEQREIVDKILAEYFPEHR